MMVVDPPKYFLGSSTWLDGEKDVYIQGLNAFDKRTYSDWHIPHLFSNGFLVPYTPAVD